MERYTTQDNQVSKYVHDDGSETAIKTTSSCSNFYNTITDKIESVMVNRNKFSVFISCSVGCPIKCKFCYLSVKGFPYYKLDRHTIMENIKDVLYTEIQNKPELKDKYMKLSWMGMGDALLLDPYDIRYVSEEVCMWAVEHKLVKGIDGIDISTTLPKKHPLLGKELTILSEYIERKLEINPNNYYRSLVRLFYSLHSVKNRYKLIPTLNSDVCKDIQFLHEFNRMYGIDILFHQIFLDGINDSIEETDDIINIINEFLPDSEVRLLRYNECVNSPYKESKKFDELVKLFSGRLKKVKYQISAGSEIKAACGMFLMKGLKNGK